MKLLQYLKQPLPLRHRLMLTIGLILLVFQLISTFWLWHESTEQIQLFEQALRENRNNDRHIMHEIREAIASLIVPGIFMVSFGAADLLPGSATYYSSAGRSAKRAGGAGSR